MLEDKKLNKISVIMSTVLDIRNETNEMYLKAMEHYWKSSEKWILRLDLLFT